METKKSRYTPAQNKATQKYQKDKLEQINFRVHKGERQRYIDAADAAGLSLAQFFVCAAEEKIYWDSLLDDNQAGREEVSQAEDAAWASSTPAAAGDVLAWDPDFTHVTPAEQQAIKSAEDGMIKNGTMPHDDINWD